MIREPAVTHPDTSIAEAVAAWHQSECRYLVIVESQHPIGWVCDRNLIQAIATGMNLETTPIRDIMSSPLPTLSTAEVDDPVRLSQVMHQQNSPCIGVLDATAQLQRIITMDDFVERYQRLPSSPPGIIDQLQARIQDLETQVSETQLLKEKLRSSEGKIRAVFEAMKDFVFVCDLNDGEINNIEVAPTNSSEGCEPDEELIATTVNQLWENPDHEWSQMIQQAITTQETVNFDYQLEVEGQPMWFTASISPLVDNSVVWVARNMTDRQDSVVWVARNITERKHFEHELQLLNQELERSNQELEQFAYVASHDLQEPLRMVISFTQLLSQQYAGQLDEQADQIIEFAVDGATRMQQLIQDLLSYSRVGTQAKVSEQVDCNQVVKTAIANLQISIQESGATLNQSPLPTLMTHPQQLTQLFQNLIGNAIKYRGDRRPVIEIGCQEQDQDYRFWVKDNGIGIEQQHADRVFMVFQRLHTRKEYAGTGIGLAICKKIIDQQGGKIWVESVVGEGSTFIFTLPKVEHPATVV
ncbi:ATP-binding protein [Acaryochloris sp. IP29b_bin.137]|uniref:ATP-binding protein n=1 Tax=Acaryochloris sp. IP29b_bin.137 TaxID=2969217 RepID=UPI00262119E8|nr:ATP-binding protein [Acaryochloris sp. IP29b_bin.137]